MFEKRGSMSRRLLFSLSFEVVSQGLDGLKYLRAIPIPTDGSTVKEDCH